MASTEPAASDLQVRVWDWPTRLFHWLLVLLIPLLWWSAETERIDLHVSLGLAALGLLLFRLIWGFVGSSTARFANFLKGPRTVMSYLSGRAAPGIGHNPLGGWSVALMLALLAVQIGLGLFATDEDGIVTGPLAHFASVAVQERATELHELSFKLLQVVILLHVGAIALYALRRRNLVGPMLTGRTRGVPGAVAMEPASPVRLGIALLLAAGATYFLARLG